MKECSNRRQQTNEFKKQAYAHCQRIQKFHCIPAWPSSVRNEVNNSSCSAAVPVTKLCKIDVFGDSLMLWFFFKLQASRWRRWSSVMFSLLHARFRRQPEETAVDVDCGASVSESDSCSQARHLALKHGPPLQILRAIRRRKRWLSLSPQTKSRLNACESPPMSTTTFPFFLIKLQPRRCRPSSSMSGADGELCKADLAQYLENPLQVTSSTRTR